MSHLFPYISYVFPCFLNNTILFREQTSVSTFADSKIKTTSMVAKQFHLYGILIQLIIINQCIYLIKLRQAQITVVTGTSWGGHNKHVLRAKFAQSHPPCCVTFINDEENVGHWNKSQSKWKISWNVIIRELNFIY